MAVVYDIVAVVVVVVDTYNLVIMITKAGNYVMTDQSSQGDVDEWLAPMDCLYYADVHGDDVHGDDVYVHGVSVHAHGLADHVYGDDVHVHGVVVHVYGVAVLVQGVDAHDDGDGYDDHDHGHEYDDDDDEYEYEAFDDHEYDLDCVDRIDHLSEVD
jgi:hypothetical protein